MLKVGGGGGGGGGMKEYVKTVIVYLECPERLLH